MTPAVSDISTQARFAGIKVRTESGLPAKIDTQDQAPAITADVETASGSVENLGEYTESHNGKDYTGTIFDAVVRNTAPGASLLTLKLDADNDAGEVRELVHEFNLTTSALEGAALEVGTQTTEPIA